jgi:hypothetical protein
LQFKGLIVLFTGQNNYSDYNREFNGLKFILLPCPCLYSDAVQVKDYYLNVHDSTKIIASKEVKSTKYKASWISSFIHNIINNVIKSSRVVFIRYCFNVLSTKQGKRNVLGQRYDYKRKSLLMNLFSKEIEKDLYTWRLVNPNKSFFNFHVSKIVDLSALTLFAYRLLLFSLGNAKQRNIRFLIAFGAMFLITHFKVTISKILRVNVSFYWYLSGVITILIQLTGFTLILLKCEKFSCNLHIPSETITTENIDESIYIGRIPVWIAIGTISLNFQSNLFSWGIFFPWPLNLLNCLTLKLLEVYDTYFQTVYIYF